jgi:serine/threonine protein phosphatase PrpC
MPSLTPSATLSVSIGQASLPSRHGYNQDFMGCVTPEGSVLRDKGMAFAVADGVGRGKGGRVAAETAVRVFLSDYYNGPDTWSARKILEQVLEHANSAARAPGPEHQGGAATFAALVFRGRRFYAAHVGDARVYLKRQGVWTRLTQDHVWHHPDMTNVVSRAIGLDTHLHPDIDQGELREGDFFLLCTDGLYKALDPESLRTEYPAGTDLQAAAESLARQVRGSDDVTLQLVRVDALPSGDDVDRRGDEEDLPLEREPREGMTLDDFYLSRLLHRGLQSQVYLAEDLRNRRTVALKFPLPGAHGAENEADLADRFLREEWLGRRVKSPHVLPALPLEPGRRSRLYYATPWEKGETLRRKLERSGPLSIADAIDVGLQVCRGLEALHRLQVLHRDVKPDNVLINEQGRALLLDLGVARAGAFTGPESMPGTPSYMAPEMFRGAEADERTEVYALGVTLYELLTRKLPYGEVEPFTQPRFSRWTPPARYNPDIPHWLETVLQKALDPDPERRFQVLSELQFHLSRREAVAADEVRRVSTVSRHTRDAMWKTAAIGFAILAVIELVLLVTRR